MNIKKQLLIDLISEVSITENYPYNLNEFIKIYADRNYEKVKDYLEMIKEHIDQFDDSIPLTELLFDADDGEGIISALITYLLKNTLDFSLFNQSEIIEGDYVVTDEPIVIEGDLTINGSIIYDMFKDFKLIVLGDLVINGNYDFDGGNLIVFGDFIINGAFDEKSDYSLTIVGGNVSVQNYLNSSGVFFSLGNVKSPIAYFSYSHGYCNLLNGFTCLFFRESDHSSSISLGSCEAEFIMTDEMIGVDSKCGLKAIKTIQSLLNTNNTESILKNVNFEAFDGEEDDIFEWLEDEYEFEIDNFIYELIEELREGKVVLQEEVLKSFLN